MKTIFFNSENNQQAEQFKEYLPVNINLRFETLASYIALCEENYILPLLGKDLIYKLQTAVQNPKIFIADAYFQLIEKIRFALIRLAVWKGYDVISANISDVGVSAEVDKENRLYRYQEENIKNTLKNEGFNYLDNILQFIEENSDIFATHADLYDKLYNNKSLIKTTAQLQECYNIDNSRLVFLKMQKYIRDVELIKLQHRIGAAFYNELLTADETNEKYSVILPYFRLFVVYSAVAESVSELHKLPTEKGLYFETSNIEGVQLSILQQTQLQETRTYYSTRADQYIAAAINIINNKKSDYENFTSFAGASASDGVIHINNSNKKFFLT